MSQNEQDALYSAIGERIRDLRSQRGLTQSELAAAVSLSRTSVTNIEAGRQRLLVHVLASMARVLGVSMAELLPDTQHAQRETVEEALLENLIEVDRNFITNLISPESEGDSQ